MACATLKRSLDFDPVHSCMNPAKRPRCIPMSVSPSSSPPRSTPSQTTRRESSSAFTGVCKKLTAETVAMGICEEICRMHLKKQLHLHPKLMEQICSSENSDTPESTQAVISAVASLPDKPLFTLRQVTSICERLITQRENQIREEYDRFLNSKLSEQYEAFVKFSNDQLQRHFDSVETPSYLS